MKTKQNQIIELICSYLSAIILMQTLYYKFGGHPSSVYIFSQLGIEPYGRIGTGMLELMTAILLIVPKTRMYGSILGIVIISGALFSHIFVLGIEVQNDGGKLFSLALITFISCLILLIIRFAEIINLINKYLYDKTSHQ